MANEVKIEIVQVKDVEKNGAKFKAYQTIPTSGEFKGKRIDLKFRRDAKNIPSERCYIYVDDDQFNISTAGRWPVVWVNTVNRIEPLKVKTNAADYFDAADADAADGNPFA